MATTMTSPITIAYPDVAGELELRIQSGTCRLKLTPVDQGAWVTGSYVDPSASIDITNETEGNRVTIRVGRSPADFFGLMSGVPELSLELGKARPFALVIEAGASENHIELGGLPLTSVQLNHGAGAAEVTFSTPNPVVMRELKFAVGAGKPRPTTCRMPIFSCCRLMAAPPVTCWISPGQPCKMRPRGFRPRWLRSRSGSHRSGLSRLRVRVCWASHRRIPVSSSAGRSGSARPRRRANRSSCASTARR